MRALFNRSLVAIVVCRLPGVISHVTIERSSILRFFPFNPNAMYMPRTRCVHAARSSIPRRVKRLSITP